MDGTRTTIHTGTGKRGTRTGLDDFSSEREIYGGDADLVLADMDVKGSHVHTHTHKVRDDDQSGIEDVESQSGGSSRQRSTDSLRDASERDASERPAYQVGARHHITSSQRIGTSPEPGMGILKTTEVKVQEDWEPRR